MKHTLENLRKLLDVLTARPKLKPAMRAIGCDQSLIFTWMKKSAAGDPAFLVDWPEGEAPLQLVEQIRIARQRSIVNLDAVVRDEVTNGVERVVIMNGKVCYKEDEQLAADALDPVQWKLIHGERPITDTYARDPLGRLIPLTTIEAVPAALRIKAITSLIPGYGDKSEVTHINQGPMILPRPDDAAPAMKVVSVDPLTGILAPDTTQHAQAPRMIVGRPAKTSDEMNAWKEQGEFNHHPVEVERDGVVEIVQAGPARPKSLEELMPLSKGKPLTPLQEDLLRLAAKKPENPHPEGAVQKFAADDREVHDKPPPANAVYDGTPNPFGEVVQRQERVPNTPSARGVLPGGCKVV